MTWIALLFLAGILFVMAEVIVPGGILGIAGAVLMLAGCVVAFVLYGANFGLLAVLAAGVLFGAAMFFEFKILPNTAIGRRAFLTKEIKAVSQAVDESARTLVGKTAEAITMLSPSGYVSVEGRRYEAFCQSGQVPAGTPLVVTGADNFRIIVTKRSHTTS